jgi:hypothetical protein
VWGGVHVAHVRARAPARTGNFSECPTISELADAGRPTIGLSYGPCNDDIYSRCGRDTISKRLPQVCKLGERLGAKMALSFEECRAVLDQFKRAHPEFLMRSEVHGVQVVQVQDKPVLVVLVTDDVKKDSLLPDEGLPDSFAYEFAGQKIFVAVQVTVGPVAKAHTGVLCHPGDPASGDPVNYFGTLGWNVYLNNVLVCLSNWHVLCAQGNDTPIGWNVSINSSLEARLYAFQALYPTGNIWDYALAQYIQPVDAAGVMRSCVDGGVLPYPGSLSSPASVHVGDGAQYYKVGARAPTCRTGTLIGVGDRKIQYDDNTIRAFQSQLIFSKMTDPGDSGAVIVRQADASVTGLNFAGSDTETIANPIFLAGWQRTGSIRFDGGAEIPMFAGNAALVSFSGAVRADALAPAKEAFVGPVVESFPPDLSTGLLFLGSAIMVGGGILYGAPPPPPIRPNVQVQVVATGSAATVPNPGIPGYVMSQAYVVLYFG